MSKIPSGDCFAAPRITIIALRNRLMELDLIMDPANINCMLEIGSLIGEMERYQIHTPMLCIGPSSAYSNELIMIHSLAQGWIFGYYSLDSRDHLPEYSDQSQNVIRDATHWMPMPPRPL